MKTSVSVLHEKALKLARTYLEAESDLISVLQQIEQCRGYLDPQIGSKNLFEYATRVLGLSRDVAYNMIAVARKGLQNAATLSKRELEMAVAEVNPKLAVREQIKPVGHSRFELRLGVSEGFHSKLKRVQDLLSSRRGEHASLEDVLEVMAELFLEKEDPVRKTERAQNRANTRAQAKTLTEPETFVPGRENDTCVSANSTHLKQSSRQKPAPANDDFPNEEEFMPRKTVPALPKRVPIPASLKHALNLRDCGKCTRLHPDGKRCQEKRWLEFHHMIPVEMGGTTTLENLTTLCRDHHRMMHA